MKLLELQEKNDEELLDFAVEEGVVEDGATPRRMDILRKMFKAYSEKDETVAILQAGYADGIPTDFSNSGGVEFNGCIYPIIGKVSMDLIAINCGEDTINEGDEAVVWGGDHENNQLEYISKKYSKIPYEFLTGVSVRVKRNLINE